MFLLDLRKIHNRNVFSTLKTIIKLNYFIQFYFRKVCFDSYQKHTKMFSFCRLLKKNIFTTLRSISFI